MVTVQPNLLTEILSAILNIIVTTSKDKEIYDQILAIMNKELIIETIKKLLDLVTNEDKMYILGQKILLKIDYESSKAQ